MRVCALVLSAGRGERLGANRPKAFVSLLGHPLLAWTLSAFETIPNVDSVIVVVPPGEEGRTAGLIDRYDLRKSAQVIPGGPRRQDSSRRGVVAAEGFDAVFIHDAARPFVSSVLVERLLAGVRRADGAVPGLPAVETIKRVDEADVVIETPERAFLRAVQTPQAFRRSSILSAFETVCPDDECEQEFTDDAAVLEAVEGQVLVVPGERENIKITVPEDMNRASAYLETHPEIRNRLERR